MTHKELLQHAQDLNINIDMYQDTVEILTFNPENLDDAVSDLASPINYDLSETCIPDRYQDKHYWIIDLQDGTPTYEAQTESELYDLLQKLVDEKEGR